MAAPYAVEVGRAAGNALICATAPTGGAVKGAFFKPISTSYANPLLGFFGTNWAAFVGSSVTASSIRTALYVYQYPDFGGSITISDVTDSGLSSAVAGGWIFYGLQVVVGSPNTTFRLWKKYGVDGAMTAVGEWSQANSGFTQGGGAAGEVQSSFIGDKYASDGSANFSVIDGRIYAQSSAPTTSWLDGKWLNPAADTEAWAHWKLQFSGGSADLSDSSGHSRPVTSFDGGNSNTLYQGAAGPIDPAAAPVAETVSAAEEISVTGGTIAATFVGKSSIASGTTGTTRTPDISALSLQAGDLVRCLIFCSYSGASSASPSFGANEGWQLAPEGSQSTGSAYRFFIYYKILGVDGQTDDSTPTITITGASKWGAILEVYRSGNGAWASTPFENTPTPTVVTSSPSSTMTAPTATAGAFGRTVLRTFVSTDNNNIGSPSEGTASISGSNVNINSGSGYACGVSYRTLVDAGSVGTATMSQGSNGPDNSVSWTHILVPAPTVHTVNLEETESLGEAVDSTVTPASGTLYEVPLGETESVGEETGAVEAAVVGAAETVTADESVSAGNDPAYGVHAMNFQEYGAQGATVATPARTTTPTTSSLFVVVSRNPHPTRSNTPTDSPKNNTFTALGDSITHVDWADSKSTAFRSFGIAGGSGHTITVSDCVGDEVAVWMQEILNAGAVQDYQTANIPASSASTSITFPTITTTGPATIVYVWLATVAANLTSYSVNNGFTIVEVQTYGTNAGSGVMAVRNVSAAGTYSTTLTIDHADAGVIFGAAFGASSSTTYTENLGETVSASESSGAQGTAAAGVGEEAAVGEAPGAQQSTSAGVGEEAAVGEDSGAQATAVGGVGETGSVGEETGVSATAVGDVGETGTVGEESGARATAVGGVSEGATVDESTGAQASAVGGVGEEASVGEEGGASAQANVALAEQVAEVVELAAQGRSVAEISEEIDITEGETVGAILAMALAEAVSKGEGFGSVLSALAQLGETGGVSDGISSGGATVYSENLEETGTFSEGTLAGLRAIADVTDSGTISAGIGHAMTALPALAEQNNLTEEQTQRALSTLGLAEQIASSEEMTGGLRYAVEVLEQCEAAEETAAAARANQALAENTGVQEAMSAFASASENLQDALAFLEDLAGGKIESISLEDALEIADAVLAAQQAMVSLDEALALSGTAAATGGTLPDVINNAVRAEVSAEEIAMAVVSPEAIPMIYVSPCA